MGTSPPRSMTEIEKTDNRKLARLMAVNRLGPTDPRVDALAAQLAHYAMTYGTHRGPPIRRTED